MKFHLTIASDPAMPGRYQVIAEAPGAPHDQGRVVGQLRVPASDLAPLREDAETAVERSTRVQRRESTEPEKAVQRVGDLLFQALPEAAGALLRKSVEQAEASGERLQVALRVEPPELARLPWELLRTKKRHPFRHHHLIRHLPTERPQAPVLAGQTLRVLAVTGAAKDLDSPRERELLERALQPLSRAGQIALEWLPEVSWERLDRALEAQDWHIFHFIGHGDYLEQTQEGALVLSDGGGGRHPMPADQFAELFTSRSSVRLVVLNACQTAVTDDTDPFSSVAGALIDQGVPAVVAMQFPITDAAAIRFSRAYYGALAHPQPVEAAVTAARRGIWMGLRRSLEWGTPVLYMSSPGDEVFRVWRPAEVAALTLGRPVTGVVFTPDSGTLLVSCQGWRAPVATQVGDWQVTPPELSWWQRLAALAFNPDLTRVVVSRDGSWLATVGADRTVRVIDRALGAPVGRPLLHPDEVHDAAFSALEGDLLATACGDGVVRFWQVDADRRVHRLPTVLRPPEPVQAVAWHPQDGRLATACDDGTATVWAPVGPMYQQQSLFGHSAAVTAVAFSPDGKLLATACQDGSARVWPVQEGAGPPPGRLAHQDGAVCAVAFSPDGQQLATAGEDHTARIWDARTGQQTFVIRHTGAVRRVAFSPDGRWLATASDDGTVQVWQLTDVTIVEVSLDDRVADSEADALTAGLRTLGFSPVTVREPVRRSWDPTPWLALLTLPLRSFVEALLTDTGQYVYRRLADWIKRRRTKRGGGEGGAGVAALGVRDLVTGVTFVWDPPPPREALRKLAELDLSGFEDRTFHYDATRGRWVPRRPPR